MAEGGGLLGRKVITNLPAGATIIGILSSHEVVLKTTNDAHIFVTNLRSGDEGEDRTTRVANLFRTPHDIFRCSFLERAGHEDGGVLVCGTCGDGEVVIFQHVRVEQKERWEPLRTIRVAQSSKLLNILVSVDQYGMIMAAAYGSSVIQIYNPNDGEKIRTICTKGIAIHQMQPLSSGNVVIRTKCTKDDKDICVVNADGNLLTRNHLHDKDVYSFDVDRSNDLIYVMYRDRNRDNLNIDTMIFTENQLVVSEHHILNFHNEIIGYPTFVLLDSQRFVVHDDTTESLHVFSFSWMDMV